jgi:hypothetical protein
MADDDPGSPSNDDRASDRPLLSAYQHLVTESTETGASSSSGTDAIDTRLGRLYPPSSASTDASSTNEWFVSAYHGLVSTVHRTTDRSDPSPLAQDEPCGDGAADAGPDCLFPDAPPPSAIADTESG